MAPDSSSSSTSPQSAAEENLNALRSFVEARQLSNFFITESGSSGSGYLADVSSKAAEYMKKYQDGSGTQNMLFANAETAANVMKLSLYNQVLYCGEFVEHTPHKKKKNLF